MKRIIFLLALLAATFDAVATDVLVYVNNFVQKPVQNRTVTVTLIETNGVGAVGPFLLSGDSVSYRTDTTGFVGYSNILTLGNYRLDISGNPGRSYPFSVNVTNGTYNVVQLLGTNASPEMFYDTAQIDAMFATNAVGGGIPAQTATNAAITVLNQGIPMMSITNVKSFGAKGSGMVANGCFMTNGNATLVVLNGAFSSTNVGNIISVYSGQTNQNLTTTISSVLNATNITLASVPSFSCTNTAAVYGPDDDAVAIQSAINFVSTNGGGTLFFPSGIYIVNGALQDPGAIKTHRNAQLFLPDLANQGQTAPTISFEGVYTPQTKELNNTNAPWTYFTAQGSIIWSTLANANGGAVLSCQNLSTNAIFYGGIGDAYDVNFNSIRFESHRLTWRSAANPNGGVLNLRGATGAALYDTLIDEGYALYCVPPPSYTNAYGVMFPANNCNGPVIGHDLQVVGFYNGLMVGEHLTSMAGYIFSCVNAVNLYEGSGHWSVMSGLDIESCKIWFFGGPSPAGFIANVTGENIGAATFPFTWDVPPTLLSNAFPNSMYGEVFYESGKSTNMLMTPGTSVRVVQTGWDGTKSLPPIHRTPFSFSDSYGQSSSYTGATFAVSILGKGDDSLQAISLWRTTANGNGYELLKDLDSAGGFFRLNSSTNAFANLNTWWSWNPVTGATINSGAGFVGSGSGLTSIPASALTGGPIPSTVTYSPSSTPAQALIGDDGSHHFTLTFPNDFLTNYSAALVDVQNVFTAPTNTFNTVVATNLIINGGPTTTVSNLNVNGWGTVQGIFTNGGPAYFSNNIVALFGGGHYGLVPSGAETNAAGSRVAYLSDVGGSGGGYTIDTSGIASNATAEVAVWTNSHLMTTTNSIQLESWVDLSGPPGSNYLAKHWDSYFRDQTFIGSNTITSFSSATNLTARWALLNSTGLVLYVKGYTNESLNYTARAIERTWQTNGVVTSAGGACSTAQITQTGSADNSFDNTLYTYLAFRFTTSSGFTTCSNAVELSMVSSGALGTVKSEIYTDNGLPAGSGGHPASLVGSASSTVNCSTISTSFGVLQGFSGISATLSPSTVYWMVIQFSQADSGSYIRWIGNSTTGVDVMGSGDGSAWDNLGTTTALHFILYSN